MAKSTKKSKKPGRKAKPSLDRKELAEKVDCLVELHKLQGVLLGDIKKQV